MDQVVQSVYISNGHKIFLIISESVWGSLKLISREVANSFVKRRLRSFGAPESCHSKEQPIFLEWEWNYFLYILHWVQSIHIFNQSSHCSALSISVHQPGFAGLSGMSVSYIQLSICKGNGWDGCYASSFGSWKSSAKLMRFQDVFWAEFVLWSLNRKVHLSVALSRPQ